MGARNRLGLPLLNEGEAAIGEEDPVFAYSGEVAAGDGEFIIRFKLTV